MQMMEITGLGQMSIAGGANASVLMILECGA